MKRLVLVTQISLVLAAGIFTPGFAETVEIRFSKKHFEPAYVEMKVGDTVRFINTDNLLHTATSGKAPEASEHFDSGYLTAKMSYEFTPTEAGVIDFFCVMHSDVMRGALKVLKGKQGEP